MKDVFVVSLLVALNSTLSVAQTTDQYLDLPSPTVKDKSTAFRKPADVSTVGPDGDVILFYQGGNDVVVRECEGYYPVPANKDMGFQRSDCKIRTGTIESRAPITEFKQHLKYALKITETFSEDVKNKALVYDEDSANQRKTLAQQKAGLEKDLQELKDKLAYWGYDASTDEATKEKLDDLDKQIANLQSQISQGANVDAATKELNDMISDLVDQKIADSSHVTSFVRSKNCSGFEFNILRTYVEEIKPIQNLGMRFKKIPAGSYDMGTNPREQDRDSDEDQRHVDIAGFYIMDAEVTQKQWKEVMGYNSSYFKGDNLPVEGVSFNEIQDFIYKLNDKNAHSGYVYRLPTEEEWEYAARGGSKTRFSFGDDPSYSQINDYAWYGNNSGSKTHAVRTKKPNAYGLYDMHGNVWEWTSSIYGDSDRVIRGGSWYNNARSVRSADRLWRWPDYRSYGSGFRLVRTKK